ncbi:stromal cell-derived factor 2 [Nilaparvata lugens]|uniref:stromal cell-derived factor 2 n=1 Tax=Nilaparvata lugens TaxID=108931 RepID=UPI00193EB5DB|nr:stromal cell-derived factor 2 [Nilaparvata lugens]
MAKFSSLDYIIFISVSIFTIQHHSVQAGVSDRTVTCGSLIKLMNGHQGVRLHSHDVKYGTGSGQQSVTGSQDVDDLNSHWIVKAETGAFCHRGNPIKCGSTIRLQHLATSKNLHSHHFHAPLTRQYQEISAYGNSGEGDTGDHWIVMCERDNYWQRDHDVMFKHVDTGVYLAVTGQTYGRPIIGQNEIVGVESPHGRETQWAAKEGVYFHTSDFDPKKHLHAHTEL